MPQWHPAEFPGYSCGKFSRGIANTSTAVTLSVYNPQYNSMSSIGPSYALSHFQRK